MQLFQDAASWEQDVGPSGMVGDQNQVMFGTEALGL
jgi:hypothetical protein